MGRRHIDLHPAARDAALVLGQQIRQARHDHNWTAAELAARAGINQNTVLAIEAGRPSTSIGNVLNVAVIAGVPLFGFDSPADLARVRRAGVERLALVPSRVRHPKVDDADYDF
jgi:transcriptional regulator with XRE-family HTH domain